MAVINPFCAYRPACGREAEIAALPYDVYNRKEACVVTKANICKLSDGLFLESGFFSGNRQSRNFFFQGSGYI